MIHFPLPDLLTSMITLGKIWRCCLRTAGRSIVVATLARAWNHRLATVATLLYALVLICLDCFVCQSTVAFQRNRRNNNAKGVSAERVRQSVDQGVTYLKDKRRNGSWSEYRSPGDVSALVTLALLNAGETPDDEKMALSLQYLADKMPRGSLTTYSASLKVMALAAADPKGKKHLREIEETVDWLLDNQVRDGGWSYMDRGGTGDSSNTQFAILALHAAVQMGIEVPQRTWEKAGKYWFKCYNRGGGFRYRIGAGENPSMSCAGISSWVIIQENLADFGDLVNGDRAVGCGSPSQMEPVDRTIEKLARNFGVAGGGYYYLYALERAGRLSGQRFFGLHDWYRSGSGYLVGRQNKLTGAWRGSKFAEDDPNIATAMALLFLAKGKRPVALAKYEYGEKDQWDNHPKGVHYLTRELESQWDTKLNWQTVRSKDASVDDLLESPVLFISGREPFSLDRQQKENLRKYVDNGGFIFAEACEGEGCGSAAGFDRSFRELMAEIFPESDLDVLAPDHQLWSAYFPITPSEERPLLGLQACCRTSVVYCTRNLSSYWNLNRPGLEPFVRKQRRPKLKERVDYCSQLGVNVVAYATGRQLRERGDTPTVKAKTAKSVLANRSFSVGTLNHSGGSDEAPNALKNIMLQVEASGLDVNLKKNLVDADHKQMRDFPILFMHGRAGFEFTAEQRQAVKAHLESGGFIFANSICSNQAFTDSFRKEMKQITDIAPAPISAADPIWTSEFNGKPVREVMLRKRDPAVQGGFRKSTGPPQLEGIEFEGRYAVVFSPWDLSCALENLTVSQCTGYTRKDAERIGFNVLLYAQRVD